MDKIILLFMLASIALLMYKEPKELFLYFFLPVLTMMPVYYQTKIVSGIPEISFWSAVLLPIAFVWILNKHGEGYRFSPLDLLILLHLVLVFSGEWHNTSYKEAQKVFYNDLTIRLLPCIMARAWFMDSDSRMKMFKIIILCGAIVAAFQLIEFRLWFNVFDDILRKIWPHSVPWGGGMKRGGLKRAAGPFGHPICAGYFFTMFVPLAIWLWKNDYFELKKHGLWMFLLCVTGAITSISRAPIAGVFMGFVIIWYGWTKNKAVATMFLASFLIVASVLVIPKFIAYVNVSRATAETEDQRNAAYRAELLDNYKEVIAEKPLFGWGRFGVPVVKGQDSVDNEYLVIVLASGYMSLYAYLASMLWVLVRLSMYAIFSDPSSREGRLAWCLLAGFIAAALTQTTVYAGTQTIQFFYMLMGFSEGLVQLKHFESQEHPAVARTLGGNDYEYNFSRTL
ncbi:MAG: O-antigen ligase family protein [Desulfuromonadales bacterium]